MTRIRHLTDIDHSDVINILSSERRRYVLQYLADQPIGESVSVSDLAEYVAARENDCSIQEITSTQRERAYISLTQRHCTVLSEILEYDDDRKAVTPTEQTAAIWEAYTAFRRSLTG